VPAVKRFIIAGTFCPPAAARRIYGPMALAIGAEILTLPGLGMGHTRRSADAVAELLPQDDFVELVGHSQGGMVALDLTTRWGSTVWKCVTLGAPLGGTTWSPAWAPFAAARCMTRRSRYMAEVIDRDPFCRYLHCVAGSRDRLVVPTRAAHLSGARNYTLERLSHTELATHPDAISLVTSILDRP
jgi:pimeloyl-ACP methyl ester carboxylesterase